MITKFTVFTKEKNKKDGGTFKVRLTRNENDTTFEVRYVSECVNTRVLPKDNRPYVLVVDTNNVSMTHKKFMVEGREKPVIKHILYVRAVEAVEEYIEPEFDVSAFNSIGNSEELPF